MKRDVLSAAAAAAAVIGFALFGQGCRGIERVESFTVPNFLVVRPERPLADVPVPLGFTYKENGSYVFSGNYRVARLQYRGTPHIEECVRYFQEQMPPSRWRFIRQAGIEGRLVTFHNDEEELRIKLDRSGGLTLLTIDIKPRPI